MIDTPLPTDDQDDSTLSAFSRWVRQMRRKAGFRTQADLADRMSEIGPEAVSTNYVWQLENDRIKVPQQPNLHQLAAALEVREADVLRATGLLTELDAPDIVVRDVGYSPDDPLMKVAFYGAENLTLDGRRLVADMLQDQIKRIQEYESDQRRRTRQGTSDERRRRRSGG